MSLEHVPFGLVQGEDGKKFATRSGETVRLKDLLDEAESRCLTELRERDSDADDLHELAKVVGIGAVKYADLSLNRESNYKFSYEKMLSLSGNTAPYMLYGYARINGIRRKAQEEVGVGKVVLKEEAERDLARHLALLSATIVDLERELRPIAREYDQADEYPTDLVEQMKELGLFGATISEEYGGLGLSASTYARIVSRICEVGRVLWTHGW